MPGWRSRRSRQAAAVLAFFAFAISPSAYGVATATTATSGTISTVAGSDAPGPMPARRLAISPMWVAPHGGAVYAADYMAPVVRRINQNGREVVVVGTGINGASVAGTAAGQAEIGGFDRNVALTATFDSSGDMIFPDLQNSRVWIVAGTSGSRYGLSMTAGDIYTLAGTGTQGFSGDGGSARRAEIGGPFAVALDGAGNVLMTTGNRVRVVAAGFGTYYGLAMKVGHIYTIAGTGSTTASGDGGPAIDAGLDYPFGLAVDPRGDVVIADATGIRVVASATHWNYGISMTAGDIYTAIPPSPFSPVAVAVDQDGNLVFDMHGAIDVWARRSGTYYGMAMSARHVYTVAGGASPSTHTTGLGAPAIGADFDPQSLAIDPSGSFVIGGGWDHRVLVIPWTDGTFYGQSMVAGHLYAIGGDGNAFPYTNSGVGLMNAMFGEISGIAVDSAGNDILPDDGHLRVLANASGSFYGVNMTAGHVYDVAGDGTFNPTQDGAAALTTGFEPRSVSLDRVGNLVVCDGSDVWVLPAAAGTFYGKQMDLGHLYRVAGGNATFSSGADPTSVSIGAQDAVGDLAGDLLITGSNRVYVLAAKTGQAFGQHVTAGAIYAISGTGQPGFAGDGGPGTSAQLDQPYGLATDQGGNVLVADAGNARLRLIAASTGSFYGQSMSAGDVDTIAGDGIPGSTGDGGPPTAAAVDPSQVVVGSNGDVVMSTGSQVRVIAGSSGTEYGLSETAGDLYTIAGAAAQGCGSGFGGDGGPGIDAVLCANGLAFNSSGSLLIPDSWTGRIRELVP